jgi:hypothetical protein
MSDKKISQLSGASLPLAGTEELPLVQGGVTKKATAQDIADLGIIIEGSGTGSTLRKGFGNSASGNYSAVLNGLANTAGNCFTTASGTSNIVCTANSHILSGQMNVIACDAIPNVSSGVNSGSGGYYNGFVSGQTTLAGCFGDLTSYYTTGSTVSSLYAYGDPQLIYTNLIVCGSSYNAGTCETTICVDPSINTCSGYIIKTGPFTTQSSYHPNVIAGGAFNTINGYTNASTISGGYNNTVSGGYGTIGGGRYHEILDSDSSGIFSGFCNRILYVGGSGFIGSGSRNLICGTPGPLLSAIYGVIVGGTCNSLSGSYDFIGNGRCNTSSSNFGFIGGGFGNVLSGSYTFIGGGKSNTSSACYSFTGGGCSNTTSGIYSFTGGGALNLTSGGYSGILGGRNNLACNSCSFIIGACITTNRDCAVFVNNLSIMDIPTSSAGLPSKSVWLDTAAGNVLKMVP